MNEIEMLFVEETSMTHHGLPVVRVDGVEYAVAETDEEADRAAEEAARESLWAFRTEYLAQYTNLSPRQIRAVQLLQEALCEDAGPVLEAILGDRLDECIRDAVSADGRGHVLSPYDGAEHDGGDVSPALEGRFLYRL